MEKNDLLFFTVCCDSIDPQLLAQNFLVSLSSLGLEGFDEVDILDPLRLDKPLRMGQDVMLKKKHMKNKNKAKKSMENRLIFKSFVCQSHKDLIYTSRAVVKTQVGI